MSQNPRRSRLTESAWFGFALRRLGGFSLSLFLLVVITFLIIPLIPGDPALAVAGTDASAETIAKLRDQMGLDDPLFERFAAYLGGLVHLDLGDSFRFGIPVTTIIAGKLPYTAVLAGSAVVVVLLCSVPLGMTVGVLTRGERRRWLDLGFNLVAGFFASIPAYVVATALILVFAITFHLLPAGGGGQPSNLVLPVAALALGPTFAVARLVRQETGSVLEQDYMRTARGRRLSAFRLHAVHALPNLLNSTLTLTGLILAALLGGSVIIETVFSYPGLGNEVVQAIIYRDYPVIQAIILVIGLVAVVVNVLVDVVIGILDPRSLEAEQND